MSARLSEWGGTFIQAEARLRNKHGLRRSGCRRQSDDELILSGISLKQENIL